MDAENQGDRNEATTRSHLIDTLLYDVLGWDRASVTQEDHQDVGQGLSYLVMEYVALEPITNRTASRREAQ